MNTLLIVILGSLSLYAMAAINLKARGPEAALHWRRQSFISTFSQCATTASTIWLRTEQNQWFTRWSMVLEGHAF